MHRFVIICVSALMFSACDRRATTVTTPPISFERTDLQIWGSLDSTLDERLEAVGRLVPKGATKDEALRILGTQGRWEEYEGFGSLRYPFHRDFIQLQFERGRFTDVYIAYTL